jgi:hypothetical protein
MSLRGFHIVFVSVCTILCLFLIVWAFVLSPLPSATSTTAGVSGIVGLLLIPFYAVYFLKKASKLHL